MERPDIIRERFHAQHLTGNGLDTPEDVVQWLCAVQAQEIPGAKWAVAQRMKSGVEADVDRAYADGTILRTHVLRPTWHFVLPVDIRWMQQLTAPRVHAFCASYYRQQELDDAVLGRCHDVIARALQGGNALTRKELGVRLAEAGIKTNALRLSFITMHAELEQLICSGPMKGKRYTYMLLDERAPGAKTLPPDEALAELTLRFFHSHGPATEKDYRWWSSLKAADARAGIEMVKDRLVQDVVDGQIYWWAEGDPAPRPMPGDACLIPEFDESYIAYQDLRFLLPTPGGKQPGSEIGDLLRPITIEGQTLGSWKPAVNNGEIVLSAMLFTPPEPEQVAAIEAAAERYGTYLNRPVTLSVSMTSQKAETLD